VRGQYQGGQDRRHRYRRIIASEDVKPGAPDLRRLKLTIDIGAGPRCRSTAHRQGAGVKRTEIAIKFKQAPFAMFRDTPIDRLFAELPHHQHRTNRSIALQFNTKVPGRPSTSTASR